MKLVRLNCLRNTYQVSKAEYCYVNPGTITYMTHHSLTGNHGDSVTGTFIRFSGDDILLAVDNMEEVIRRLEGTDDK